MSAPAADAPDSGENAQGRSVRDTATCTKPPRGLAGQLLYGDSIERLRLGNSVSAQAKGCVIAIALPNGISPTQSTAKRFSTSPVHVIWTGNSRPRILRTPRPPALPILPHIVPFSVPAREDRQRSVVLWALFSPGIRKALRAASVSEATWIAGTWRVSRF